MEFAVLTPILRMPGGPVALGPRLVFAVVGVRSPIAAAAIRGVGVAGTRALGKSAAPGVWGRTSNGSPQAWHCLTAFIRHSPPAANGKGTAGIASVRRGTSLLVSQILKSDPGYLEILPDSSSQVLCGSQRRCRAGISPRVARSAKEGALTG